MFDLSKTSWVQLKKLEKELEKEIENREKGNPTSYRCGICKQFHGSSNEDVLIHQEEEHGSPDESNIIPLWP